jgi:preprotein translocase subunit YajC
MTEINPFNPAVVLPIRLTVMGATSRPNRKKSRQMKNLTKSLKQIISC